MAMITDQIIPMVTVTTITLRLHLLLRNECINTKFTFAITYFYLFKNLFIFESLSFYFIFINCVILFHLISSK